LKRGDIPTDISHKAQIRNGFLLEYPQSNGGYIEKDKTQNELNKLATPKTKWRIAWPIM